MSFQRDLLVFHHGCSIYHHFFYHLQLLQGLPFLERRRDNAGKDFSVRLLGGGLAGITAASATYPLDLVRTRLAAQVFVFSLFLFFLPKFFTLFGYLRRFLLINKKKKETSKTGVSFKFGVVLVMAVCT